MAHELLKKLNDYYKLRQPGATVVCPDAGPVTVQLLLQIRYDTLI